MSDEPQAVIDGLLRDQIRTLETNLKDRMDADRKAANQRFDTQDKTLQRIEGKVDKTNGRVTTLERARERAQGVVSAFRWLPVVLSALLTAGTTILIMALTGGLHG